MLLSKKEVCAFTSYSSEHIRRLVIAGQFPAPIELNTANGIGWTRKAWLKSEVERWVAAKVARRDAGLSNPREREISLRASAASHRG